MSNVRQYNGNLTKSIFHLVAISFIYSNCLIGLTGISVPLTKTLLQISIFEVNLPLNIITNKKLKNQ